MLDSFKRYVVEATYNNNVVGRWFFWNKYKATEHFNLLHAWCCKVSGVGSGKIVHSPAGTARLFYGKAGGIYTAREFKKVR